MRVSAAAVPGPIKQRIGQVAMKPVFANTAGHCVQSNRLDACRFELAEGVTADASEAFRANHLPAERHAPLIWFIGADDLGFRARVHSREDRGEVTCV